METTIEAPGPLVKRLALGGPMYLIQAEVEHGRKLGRKLGFPTANLPLAASETPPMFGVYAARAVLPDGRRVDGVASAGVNPSVGAVAPVLEMHIFNFAEDLYGQALLVELWAFIREERTFDSLDALTAQIAHDVAEAQDLLRAA